jgi:hypothetical protein
MNDLLHVLLGAALVSIGVFVSALADRIRQLRAMHAAHVPAREPAPAREIKRAAAAVEAPSPGSDDVVAVLIAAGYRKPLAAKAVAACTPSEQSSPESWTRAALRRCATGGAS